ncbi:5-formyltetrahydrofolate cyclo-ligase [Actinobacillus equuli]|nr:5-formyltetrahydrofolate cyclo-ligase [Actinobacillus equuli]
MQTSQSRRETRQFIRNQMRAKRLELTTHQQITASLNLIPQALSLIDYYQASHLAFYLPFKAEISPLPLMQHLAEQGKSIYLPVLHPFSPGNLLFCNTIRLLNLNAMHSVCSSLNLIFVS